MFVSIPLACLLMTTLVAPLSGHPLNVELNSELKSPTPVPSVVANHTESATDDVRAVIDPPVIIHRKSPEEKKPAIRVPNRSQFFSTLPIIRWDFGR